MLVHGRWALLHHSMHGDGMHGEEVGERLL